MQKLELLAPTRQEEGEGKNQNGKQTTQPRQRGFGTWPNRHHFRYRHTRSWTLPPYQKLEEKISVMSL